jgi:hypothetical protein
MQAGNPFLGGNLDSFKQIRVTSQGIHPSPSSLAILLLTSHDLDLYHSSRSFLVLEEVIPLIVLYAPGMLPSTCILASQRERIDAKRREKQRSYAETMPDAFLDVLKVGPKALASSLPSTISSIGLCGKVNFDVMDRGTCSLLFSAQSLVSVDVGSRFTA